ncbi:HET-domain-containing protein, partial [Corynespora cassiicola Philippines]
FINLKLVRRWLDTCITRHDTCKLPALLHLKERLYLIDVKYECIVQLFTPDIEYTALSYVWGNSDVTKATSSNIRDLMKPQALSKSSNIIIPSTIRDAMYLTKSLGKQYIWVDSLCIL